MDLSCLHIADATQQERPKRRLRRRRAMPQDSISCVARDISLDLLIEILTRLPAKSITRFKCLSKFWSSLFYSRYFCNRFLMVPSPNQPRLYMSLLDVYDYSKSLLLSSAPATCQSSLVFDQDLTISEMGGYYMRLLRGFISFTVYHKARIYNPTTRQLVFVPAIESDIIAEEDVYSTMYFMCHDPVNDQYKLLSTITVISKDMQKIRSERWVFVLEAGGSWKRVAKEFHPHIPSQLELTMNGILYYLALIDWHTCVLVSFNIRSEDFNMMQVPCKVRDEQDRLRRMTLIEYCGKVAAFDTTYIKETGTVDLWVVEDWRKKEWSRKARFLQPSQMKLVINNNIFTRCQTLKGKVILVPEELISPFYFLCYDLQTNNLEKVEIKGIPDHWFSKLETTMYFDMKFMDPNETILYLET